MAGTGCGFITSEMTFASRTIIIRISASRASCREPVPAPRCRRWSNRPDGSEPTLRNRCEGDRWGEPQLRGSLGSRLRCCGRGARRALSARDAPRGIGCEWSPQAFHGPPAQLRILISFRGFRYQSASVRHIGPFGPANPLIAGEQQHRRYQRKFAGPHVVRGDPATAPPDYAIQRRAVWLESLRSGVAPSSIIYIMYFRRGWRQSADDFEKIIMNICPPCGQYTSATPGRADGNKTSV